MKQYVLIITCFFCSTQLLLSQEDGVASLEIPVRNSLRFNRYALNPTFSFVREQNRYISFTNKRQWVQFDNAPLTYLASYSGRFRENIGIGVGFFQQDYGVLTSFGGLLNFAYNARLQQENNLTFGLNVGFYKSGLNEGKVITNVPDPSLSNIPSNFLLSISPGINYGTQFFDFGLSVNNLVQYNLNSSELLEDDPQQSIQAHIMYTGYMDSRGFFDESKFSTLVRTELKKDVTIISGIAMITVPKGIWGQVGYNSLYGFSGGLGLNITNQIAIEYNFEKAVGELTSFGSSHEITLAYKFKNKDNYDYNGNDEETAFLIPEKSNRVLAKPTLSAEARAQRAQERTEAAAKAKADKEAKIAAETSAKAKAVENAQLAQQNKTELDLKAKAAEEARIAEEKLKEIELQAKAKAKAEEEAKLTAEVAAKAKAAEEARIAEEKLKEIELQAKAKAKAEEEAKLAAEVAAKAIAAEEARIAEEKLKEIELQAKAKAKAEEEAKLAAEVAAKAIAAEEARIAEEKLKEIELQAKAKAKADKEAKLAAEVAAKAKIEEEARIAEEKLKEIEVLAKAKRKITHKDGIATTMFDLSELANKVKTKQVDLLNRLNKAVESKNNDLQDLKQENDLSEQGIYQEPKPFKSISAENRALEALMSETDANINKLNKDIVDLESVLNERLKAIPNKNDETNLYYSNLIQELKNEQKNTKRYNTALVSRLEEINVALEFERNRRIKRALYDNEEDRYEKDRAALNRIKENVEIGSLQLTEEDFDFGEERVIDNIQIVKGVKNLDDGYYVVLAVHNNIAKRDDFLVKAMAAGQANINFFYDVNTSKYFIYHQKHFSIKDARNAIKNNDGKSYNSKMSIVKIEK